VPEFEVQPDALAQAGGQTARLASDVRDLLREVTGDGSAALPGLTVEPALGDLLTEFQRGLGTLATALSQHGTALTGAAGAYRDTDRNVADATDRTASGGSAPA